MTAAERVARGAALLPAFEPEIPRDRAEGAAQDVVDAADRRGRALTDDEVENLIACRVPMRAARTAAPRVAAALRGLVDLGETERWPGGTP